MADFIEDDDELEQFKRWWRDSGQQLLMIVALCVAGYFGWQTWQNHQQANAEAGYNAYAELQQATKIEPGENYTQEQKDTITHLAVTIKDEYAGGQYGYYAQLMLAKMAYLNNDAELAIKELTAVMGDADEGLASIARLRLAKIEAEVSGPDAGLIRLTGVNVPAFSSSYAEARGDFYLQKGDIALAHEQYNLALQNLGQHEQQYQAILAGKLSWTTEGGETPELNEEQG